ncbi:MAG: 23S rRNA (pseudouridine(1915)-N(3))-methyltransferase RlmH [Bacilli bacterium]|jgi:23S rRNA (pseudouridine1915-N3)-methyltransferase|nr:23S rRNA (pseudouridine(1915)-N(3))-methyltransferase RlmH [Bacilli bacterium]
MIKILCVGKIKESFFTEGIKEYQKRIEGYTKFSILEVKEVNTQDINKNILEEGKNLLGKIAEDEYVITLEIKGKRIDSVELAKLIEEKQTYGFSKITFVIGGSNGLSEEVIRRSNYHLSFSEFTFPHQLMRLILAEQIYRALTIINNKEYHK